MRYARNGVIFGAKSEVQASAFTNAGYKRVEESVEEVPEKATEEKATEEKAPTKPTRRPAHRHPRPRTETEG